MPTPENAEFRRGAPGVDEQMSQGEAAELNDGLELAREMDAGTEDVGPGPAGAEAPDDSMDQASTADFEPKGGALNEDSKFVTGPTLKPNEAQWVGARTASGPVSPRVRRRLHTLQKAASAPGASPRLQAMVKWLLENS
jgi:hypothetical protein